MDFNREYPGASYVTNIDQGGLWPDKNEVMVDADSGAAGFGSNYRHAGNVALIKNEIANKLATNTGINWLDKSTRKIGDVVGGIAGYGLGLGHELSSSSPIFNKTLNTGILDYGVMPEKTNPEAGLFNPEFLEDIAANKFGAWYGKTGITSANVVNEIAKSLATEEGPDIDYLNELALKNQSLMNQEDFRKIFINRYYKSAQEKRSSQGVSSGPTVKLKKAAADAAAAAPTSHAEARSTGGDYHSGHQSTVGGQTTDWGSESAMIARGGLAQYAPRGSYLNGGLASLWLR
jgi:hypothetical protein